MATAVDGLGIDALAAFFLAAGYERRDELLFSAKKLRAFWFAPPPEADDVGPQDPTAGGDEVAGPLPRVFISELLVDELSAPAQSVIRRYTAAAAALAQHAMVSRITGVLPWPVPGIADYQALARESEYAAWTLVNGFALNHATVSVHRLQPNLNDLESLVNALQDEGFILNEEGNVIKVSPDGGLLQSATIADPVPYVLANGETLQVPASYIEFAERRVLATFSHLPLELVQEKHRRDGFEVSNADKIFESTFLSQRMS
eukprot:SM000247S08298  [mRNA]  locus=s247:39542:41649:- [translate_table: standard]